jgi:hypothetical protein
MLELRGRFKAFQEIVLSGLRLVLEDLVRQPTATNIWMIGENLKINTKQDHN